MPPINLLTNYRLSANWGDVSTQLMAQPRTPDHILPIQVWLALRDPNVNPVRALVPFPALVDIGFDGIIAVPTERLVGLLGGEPSVESDLGVVSLRRAGGELSSRCRGLEFWGYEEDNGPYPNAPVLAGSLLSEYVEVHELLGASGSIGPRPVLFGRAALRLLRADFRADYHVTRRCTLIANP